MLLKNMIKMILLLNILFLSACMNKHGISAKYYSDCKEYYDLQGFYHKECGKDDMITYKKLGEKIDKTIDSFSKIKPKEKKNI